MSHHEAQLRQRLARQTGLASDLLERATVSGFVDQRCRQLELRDERAYFRLLEHSQEELERLVQEVAVAETWFFRYPSSYQLLLNHLRQLFQRDSRPHAVADAECRLRHRRGALFDGHGGCGSRMAAVAHRRGCCGPTPGIADRRTPRDLSAAGAARIVPRLVPAMACRHRTTHCKWTRGLWKWSTSSALMY